MEKSKVFEYELSKIKDDKIREFTRQALEKVPDYFYEVAASSTGKYHPPLSQGKGGLCRHTKAAVWIALELLNLEMFNKYTDLDRDMIISALLLHDVIKHGTNGSKYTVTEHPLLVRKYIDQYEEIKNIIDEKVYNKIMEYIETHMGQ